MILTVEAGGYRTAAAAFAGANEVAALQHGELARALDGLAGMAGSDTTSLEFSQAYDAAATQALGGLGDLVAAFATLGHLTDGSLRNHAHAESAATLFHATAGDEASAAYVAVAPLAPPTSFGGTPPTLTSMQLWVLHHVEGFVWPDADTARLRDAARTWRAAAESLHVLADHCTTASDALSTQRSPEIPTAVSATRSLRRTVFDLAASYGALATHCDTYAAEVDAKHAELLAVLNEIVRIAAEQLALSAVLGAVSFGLGAAASLGVLVARIALEAPRLLRIIEALKLLADGVATAVRTTHDALALRRLELAPYLRVPVRDERGSIRLFGDDWEPGWLAGHEHSGSHTLSRHVGWTEAELETRVRREGRELASSFADQGTAERFGHRVIQLNRARISDWLAGRTGQLRLVERFDGEVTGRSVNAAGVSFDVSRVRMLLRRDVSMPEGYRVHTFFPQP